ncbi:MAG: hypothetical protein WC372_11105 [Candidatus Neomarinimicrobiota bacterium]|jgi:hypothetical protein
MKHNSLTKKVKELITNATRREMIEKYISRIEGSGMVDIESYDDNYLLPKIIACAIFEELSWQSQPLDNKSKKLAKELQRYAL